jgi:DNA-directed RNA polymerase specialized sigma24 family protein
VFTLRHVRGLELLEIAAAVDSSESTVRRELRRAERQVTALSEREPALVHYLAKSKRHADGRPRVEP